MEIFQAVFPLAVSLGKMVVEYATASAARRAELVAEADEAYAKCKATVMSLAEKVADNNANADKIASSKP